MPDAGREECCGTAAQVVAACDSEATSCVEGRAHIKDLSRLGRDLARVVLVDNSAWSFLAQPANGVPVAPFLGNLGDRRAPPARGLAPLTRASVANLMVAEKKQGRWRLMRMASNLQPCLLPGMRVECFGCDFWAASRMHVHARGS